MTVDGNKKCVAVTGSNGYVGSAIVRALHGAGYRVLQLQRSGNDANVRSFSLGTRPDRELFDGVSGLIHCAYDFNAAGWPEIERINVHGSLALFEEARDAGLDTMIFISSMSAFEGCRSMYGRAKLEVERKSSNLGVQSIRSGLVYGSGSDGTGGGGMVAALSKLVGVPLLTPLVGSGKQVLYLVDESDLGRMIIDLCMASKPPFATPVIAASDRPYTLRKILDVLARRRGIKKTFLPVPWQLEWAALRFAELLGLRMRMRSDSLISLINQDPHPDFSNSRRFVFRDFETAFSR